MKHGIETNGNPGWIRLQGQRHDAELRLAIIDSGSALGAVAATAQGRGIGLANTRARLEQLFGKTYSFSTGYEGPNFAVRLTIPYQES